MNETIRRFGYPDTLVAEYGHWLVLLRPAQPTLFSLVLAAKGEATDFASLPPAAFAEMHEVIGDIETALRGAVAFERINYLMLMMVDPHVHFHVVPRYSGERTACGITVEDKGWPKVPALGEAVALESNGIAALVARLGEFWPA